MNRTATLVPPMQRRLPVIGIGQPRSAVGTVDLRDDLRDDHVADRHAGDRYGDPGTVVRVPLPPPPAPVVDIVPMELRPARPADRDARRAALRAALVAVQPMGPDELEALRPRATPEPTRHGRSTSTVALALSGWIALAAFALPAGSTVRLIATWGFIFTCPGLVLVRVARLRDPLERIVYSLAGSGALAALVSMFYVLLGWGSALSTVATLAALTTVGAVVADRRSATAA